MQLALDFTTPANPKPAIKLLKGWHQIERGGLQILATHNTEEVLKDLETMDYKGYVVAPNFPAWKSFGKKYEWKRFKYPFAESWRESYNLAETKEEAIKNTLCKK